MLGVVVGAGNKALLSRADRCVCGVGILGRSTWLWSAFTLSVKQDTQQAYLPAKVKAVTAVCACLPDDTVPASHLCAPPPTAHHL